VRNITENLAQVRARITKAAVAAGRDPRAIRLLAVSKTRPLADLETAIAAGQRAFGENYLQDALVKIRALGPAAEWHFIGPLQSNKTRAVAEHFAWIHSIDRLRIAARLSTQRPADLPPLNVCLQVNISGETSKSGLHPDEVAELAPRVAELPGLRLRGLMTLPAAARDPVQQRQPFRLLRELMEQLQRDGLELDTLSMGMSHDLEAAVAEGATMVRIGTAIFGARLR